MSEWLENRHKRHVRDTFEVGKLYFKWDSYLHIFLRSAIFPYNSLYTQAVAYTTYFELGEPVSKTLRKINSPGTFALSLLTSSTVVMIVSKWVALVWRKTDFGQSIRPAGNQLNPGNPMRLRFLTALNTSSWKDLWSKDDSTQSENSPSFQISLT